MSPRTKIDSTVPDLDLEGEIFIKQVFIEQKI